jgi:hypothetical protein
VSIMYGPLAGQDIFARTQLPFTTGAMQGLSGLFSTPQAYPSALPAADNLTAGTEAMGLMQNPFAALGGMDNSAFAGMNMSTAMQSPLMSVLTTYMQLMQVAQQICAMFEQQNGGQNGLNGLDGGNGQDGGANNDTPVDNGGANDNTPVDNGGANGIQSGNATVNLAEKYLGRDSIGLKGDLPKFQAAGGVTNDCADFVSSCLEDTGRLKGHEINVGHLESSLKQQGYKQVPRAQAQPGDVWISDSAGHTELVAAAGGKKLIGSNGSARQHVSIDTYSGMNGGRFYHKFA